MFRWFSFLAVWSPCLKIHELTSAPVFALADGISIYEAEKMFDGFFSLKDSPDSLISGLHKVLDHSRDAQSNSARELSAKTGVKSVAGLTVYAILNNLIDANSVQ